LSPTAESQMAERLESHRVALTFHRGSCHCGAVQFTVELDPSPERLAALPVVHEDGREDRWDVEPKERSYL
jgi:hypothetical protein